MTIYLATNKAVDFGGGAFDQSTAGRYDDTFVSSGVAITNVINYAYPLAIAHDRDTTGDSEAWFHFDAWMKTTLSFTVDGNWMRLNAADGSILAYIDVSNGRFFGRCYNAAGAYTTNGNSFVLPDESLNSWDMQYTDDGTTCYFRIYMNGNLVQETSHASTGTAKMPVRIQWEHNDFIHDAGETVYSQVIIANESTVGMKMQVVEPNAIGNYNDLSTTVIEMTDNDPSTGWSGGVAGEKQSFTNAGYMAPVGRQIHSVIPMFDIRTGTTGPQNVRPFLRISGTDYLAPADMAPNAITKRSLMGHAWTLNPATSAAWDAASITALEAGYEVKA